jgi:hypothetical protein
MRTTKQLIETLNTIGNRTQTEAGGDQNGAKLRLADDTAEIESVVRLLTTMMK